MNWAFGYFCGVATCALIWYAVKAIFALWVGPMLDKHDRGHE